MPTPAEHEELLRGLGSTPKRIPVSYLYDARGSSLYEDITDLPSYYPYNEERNLLRAKADAISKYIPADAVVVELGCGPATKTTILLEALARRHGRSGLCPSASALWPLPFCFYPLAPSGAVQGLLPPLPCICISTTFLQGTRRELKRALLFLLCPPN